MSSSLPTSLTPAPLEPHLDYSDLGPSFASLLATFPGLSDAALAVLPPEWVSLPGLLVTLIVDEGMSTEMAAYEADVPEHLVLAYRCIMGI